MNDAPFLVGHSGDVEGCTADEAGEEADNEGGEKADDDEAAANSSS